MTINPHPGVGSSDPEVFSTGPIGPVPQHHGGDLVRCGVPGVGEFRALWVDETTLAWPGSLFPRGAGAGVYALCRYGDHFGLYLCGVLMHVYVVGCNESPVII